MNIAGKLALLVLSGTLCSCAPVQNNNETPSGIHGQATLERLQNLLPGTYSNFAQTHQNSTDALVTDIFIRQLKTIDESVFLIERQQRGVNQSSYDLYWLKLNAQTSQAEFHFTRLRQDELSLPTQEILSTAWQRVQPGCVVSMKQAEGQIIGRTDPETCVFEHPLQGETRLTRSLSMGEHALIIQNKLEDSSGQSSVDSESLELLKHRAYTGWASTRTEAGVDSDKPGEWQLSTVFALRDDGRVNQLRDQDRGLLGFGLQLSRLYRIEGEAPYLLLSVIHLESGATQAFNWFEPSEENLNLNLDWFQANLELNQPEENQTR